jgi:type III pantothenate kinase
MLAAIDCGNTNTVVGIYDGATILASFRLASRRDATVEEFALAIDGMLRFRGLDRGQIDSVCIASVVPSVGSVLEDAVKMLFAVEPLVVGPGTKTGIRVSYESPSDVGPDRIVNAVAAHARYPMNTIVIDLGTATTFDAVTADGCYLGGVIVPGIAMGLDALSARTARLPRAGFARTDAVIGRNTVASIQSGAYWGLVSMLEGLTLRMKMEFDGPVKVLATGGLCGLVRRDCPFIDEVNGDLTLDGLRIIWEKNRAAFPGHSVDGASGE